MNAARLFSLLLLSASFAACTSDPSSADAPTKAPDISVNAIDTSMQSSVKARVDSAKPVRPMPENLRPTDYAVPERKVKTNQ
jgi:hypothetical protein